MQLLSLVGRSDSELQGMRYGIIGDIQRGCIIKPSQFGVARSILGWAQGFLHIRRKMRQAIQLLEVLRGRGMRETTLLK